MSKTDGSLRALIIQHEAPTPPGVVSEWLDDRGADVDVLRIDSEDRDVTPRDYDVIVSLGSQYAAFDDWLPWIEREKRLFLDATEADVPILGLCFGGQLLARVLGGECWRGELSEVGWLPVRSQNLELVPEGPWFQWHFDTFTLPPEAQLIADSDAGPQVFAIGRSLGVQFHPEVTAEIMLAWVRAYPHELAEVGVDPDQLLEETDRVADASRQVALQMFEQFADEVAGLQRRIPDARAGRVKARKTLS
ncbi:MAG: type 1 glutamine amidotransferase [Gammaproteobacteria bacterium]|nr:MAG: type 1 glutamine amidotransferase [Gammaproteobacteria bacterium]